MSKRKQIENLEDRMEALEEVVDFLTQDTVQPGDFVPESDLVHQAYASRSAHPSIGDTNAFVAGYVARAKEEYGVYAP